MADRTVDLEYLKTRIARTLGVKKKRRAPRKRRSNGAAEPTIAASVANATTAALAVLASDGTTWVEGAVEQTHRTLHDVLQNKRSTGRIWLPSFAALGAVDVALTSSAVARSMKGLELVGAAGGVGLIAASTLDLWHAETPEQALDAGSDFAWGAQGLSYLVATPRAAQVAVGLGFVGAVVQISAGVLRLTRGIQRGDAEAMKLGALDLGGGMLWVGWDVAGWSNPLLLGSYVVLMIGREAYANRKALEKWLAARGVSRFAFAPAATM